MNFVTHCKNRSGHVDWGEFWARFRRVVLDMFEINSEEQFKIIRKKCGFKNQLIKLGVVDILKLNYNDEACFSYGA